MADNELGMFLRLRREAVAPAQVGLPAGARRRTPGLRRDEVASLAAVSVEYLTRIERGRDRRPSARVLSTLADALRLTASDRVHLYRLTKTDFACRGVAAPAVTVRPAVRAILGHLEPAAAVLVNQLGEALAHTPAYARLAGPFGLLDGEPPSMVRFVFTDGRARKAFPDWEQVADEQVALLKRGPFRADLAIARLVEELTVVAGEDFTRRLDRVPGVPRATGVLRLGELHLAYETLELPVEDNQWLIVYLPVPELADGQS